jgi:tellurite resistance protein TerC
VFAFFRTPPQEQRRVLVWGILGAMVLRAIMILLGAALIQQFHYTLAFFGLVLLYSGIKLLFHDEDADPGKSIMVRTLRKILPLTEGSFAGDDAQGGPPPTESARSRSNGYRGSKFFVHENGAWKCTPLFLVLLVIEGSDVVFAVDSVPAIFGVTEDPFIVFTSNMFAILGLRALFFVIAAAIQKLRYLNYGLSVVLCFIGVKMLLPFIHEFALKTWQVDLQLPFLGEHLHVSTTQSLVTICVILGGTTALSLWKSGDADASGEHPVLAQAAAEQAQAEATSEEEGEAQAAAAEAKEESA